ncbi:hypothetical protein D3C80_1713530 [compost metagenome]
MLGEVGGDQGDQEQFAEHHRGGHGQVAPWANAAAGRQFFRFLQVQQDAPTVLHVALARFGQPQTTGAACQQQRAQALFQARNHAGHARRRHAHQFCPASEAFRLGHGQQHLHLLEPVHDHRPMSRVA